MSIETSATQQLKGALQEYWGYDSFRPLQQEAMEAVLADRDSVVVLPTGGGKSLCFQAPAVCRPGVAIVVSPLISLMKDQVDALRACGIPAAAINSSLSPEEKREVANQLHSGELKLLYVAPERLLLDGTLTFLTQFEISLIAIDEAHCISSWGHDFRPEYRGLAKLKEVWPNVAMHAYTATAPERVRQDIAAQLGFNNPAMLVGSFDRPNLHYKVLRASGKLQQIQQVIGRHPDESGIVYCISRKEVEKTAGALNALGIRAKPYHAGLSDEQRKRSQDDFINERIDVIVATVAFGMGIDKSNVRYVVHAGMPKSLENYQQESGRAGRDGLDAECLLLYSAGDAMTWRKLTDMSDPDAAAAAFKAIDAMSNYASSVVCRHAQLVAHFGQQLGKENCGACDICSGDVETIDDALVVGQKILSCVARLEQRFGGDYTAKVLTGSKEERIAQQGHHGLSTYGLLGDHSHRDVRDWIEQLVGQGFLVKTGDFDVLHLTDSGFALLKGQATPRLLKPAKKSRKPAAKSPASKSDDWAGVDRDLFELLRGMRSEIAGEMAVPAYIVFGDAALRDMARVRPASLGTFAEVKGVGQKKLAEYGERFVQEITAYCVENNVPQDVDLDSDSAASTRHPSGESGGTSAADAAGSLEGVTASAAMAFEQFRNGASIEEVAATMSRANSTVVGYLNQFLRYEQITDPSQWVDSTTALQIESAIEQVGLSGLKPIYEQLGGEVDYDLIRIVATCAGNRE